MEGYPQLRQTVIDAVDVRRVAEFYRELLGLAYRSGDEPPPDGTRDDADWLVLVAADGTRRLAFQRVERLPRTNWPEAPGIPMQLHLDLSVPSIEDLQRQRRRALSLGARQRLDRSQDPDEPLFALIDPAGHPFCIFVA